MASKYPSIKPHISSLEVREESFKNKLIMILKIAELERILEITNLNERMKIILNIFLSALNDWPLNVLSIDEYITQIEKYINAIPTKNKLEHSLKGIDLNKNAWYAESITLLLEVYNYYSQDYSLAEILENTKKELVNSSLLNFRKY